ncbi:MAG: thiaminase II [Proteobacteria bacterium]|nr:thiaminase II [Pseudomonadota bacterium]NIS71709.1 thiaminase II [Pseudomonadota bacterium]
MKYTNRLRQYTHEIWEANYYHPFVQAIGSGTLSEEKFEFYLAQDYVYLKDYCRLLALGVAKGHNLKSMGRLSELLQTTLQVEMDLHRAICADFNLSPQDLEATEPAPNCLGYTSYLLRIAYEGDSLDFLAAFLPCAWGYVEIGRRLKRKGLPQHAHYAKWIETYASPEFWEFTESIKEEINHLAQGLPPQKLERLQEIFKFSCRWEYLFWEMAWTEQRWTDS